jgi:ParB family transcriptional regulator, chromosome partitioning protein
LLLTDMVPGQYQPRTHMDEGALYELAESIKVQGIMQPILVRRLEASDGLQRLRAQQGGADVDAVTRGDRPVYEIIAGERRFRAARLAGLNPLEEAQGLQRLVKEFGLTHEQAAQAVGRSRSAASNLLRLLQLADPVQTMLMAGDLEMGHARALLALERAAQITAASQIAARKMSVREAEALVKKLSAEFSLTSPKPKKEKSRDVRRLEEELSDLLTADVEIRIKKRVKRGGRMQEQGEVAIQFGSLEELNGLIDKLSHNASR